MDKINPRLKRVIDRLVNKNQMAFIKGRQNMDAAVCVDSRMKGGDEPRVV